MNVPTYRAYLRLPPQRVAEKTTTPHRDLAVEALRRIVAAHRGESGAAVLTCDGHNLEYIELSQRPSVCAMCGYVGAFIDEGETCPKCSHVR